VLLESSALEAEGEALAMGARAALQSDIPSSSLAAALAAVDAGLIVFGAQCARVIAVGESSSIRRRNHSQSRRK